MPIPPPLTSTALPILAHFAMFLAAMRDTSGPPLDFADPVPGARGVRGRRSRRGLGTPPVAMIRACAAALIFSDVCFRNSGSAHLFRTPSLIRFLCSSVLGIIFAMRTC